MGGYYSDLQHWTVCLGVAFPNGSLKIFFQLHKIFFMNTQSMTGPLWSWC
jgi:hypothetical protein